MERKEHATPPRAALHRSAGRRLLKSKDAASGSDAYIEALEKIVYDYPDDIEAKAFIALHLWEARNNGQKIRSHLAVDALIGEVLAVEPMHPVHHYRIHLWDYEKPERALASAARCGQAAPSIAHMWHMPGHIYSRLKRYDDAAWQQEASARTDHAHMMRDHLLPDQIHNFAHNNEWLIRNLIFVGRIHDALDLAKNMIELPRHPKFNTLVQERLQRKLRSHALAAGAGRRSALAGNTEAGRIALPGENRLGADRRSNGWRPSAEPTIAWATNPKSSGSAASCRRCSARNRANEIAEARPLPVRRVKPSRMRSRSTRRRRRRAASWTVRFAVSNVRCTRWTLITPPKAGTGRRPYAIWKSPAVAIPSCWPGGRSESGDADRAIEILQEEVKGHDRETLPLAHLAALQWDLNQTDAAAETMQQLRPLSADLRSAGPAVFSTGPAGDAAGLAPRLANRQPRRPTTSVSDLRSTHSARSAGSRPPRRIGRWRTRTTNAVSLSDYRGRAGGRHFLPGLWLPALRRTATRLRPTNR